MHRSDGGALGRLIAASLDVYGAASTGMTDGMEYSYALLDDLFARKAA